MPGENPSSAPTPITPELELLWLNLLIFNVDLYLQEITKFNEKDVIRNHLVKIFRDLSPYVTMADFRVYLVNMVVCIDRLFAKRKDINLKAFIHIVEIFLLIAIKNSSNYQIAKNFLEVSGFSKEKNWKDVESELLQMIEWRVPNDNLDDPIYLEYYVMLMCFQPGQAVSLVKPLSAAAAEPDDSKSYELIFAEYGNGKNSSESAIIPPFRFMQGSVPAPAAAAAPLPTALPEQRVEAKAEAVAKATSGAASAAVPLKQEEDGDAKMTEVKLEAHAGGKKNAREEERTNKKIKTGNGLNDAVFCQPHPGNPQQDPYAHIASASFFNPFVFAHAKRKFAETETAPVPEPKAFLA